MESGMKFIKQWGPVGVATHYTISILAQILIYMMVYTNRDTILGWMPDYIPRTGTDLVIALAIHKFTLCVRIPFTLFLAPHVLKVVKMTPLAHYLVTPEQAGEGTPLTEKTAKKE